MGYLDEKDFYKKGLSNSIQIVLDGNDYGVGQVEAATDQANNTSIALGNLLVLLEKKGMIGKKDVYEIVTGYKAE